MTSIRLAARRPIFRCLNAPASRPQLRRVAQQSKPQREHLSDLEYVSVHRAEAMRRAQLIRRRNWLALGAALSMIAPIILVRFWELPPDEENEDAQKEKEEETKSRGVLDLITPKPTQTDSPRAASEEFQGKKVVIAPGDKVIAAPADAEHPTASDVDTIELIETGTSYVPYFPKTISLPVPTGPEAIESQAEYQLLGLGIRKVSFLRVQVYVVGLYVRSSDIHILQNHLINTVNPTASALIPGEKEDLRKALLDPEKSTQIWDAILARKGVDGIDMAFRVVPTRGTDFNHLRDGWMRGIASRTDEVRKRQADLLRQQATENKQISLPKPVDEGEFGDESFGLAMKEFKGLFQGKGKAPKGSVLILTRGKDGEFGAWYQPTINTNKGEKMGETTKLGSVRDERVSKLVWQLYLSGQNVSSEEARKNIVNGCIAITERPVGTVEGRVL
ncbi:Altered inheritance of mitochondria protein 18 mitochondrial [Didymosphaeria variabile]|uniref:Altered inheritance of mitochondria protein 18 mitochondrial n=1 Tax=Didymosphaeria variabile TaxID=1932322 RepID=A0A9W8XYA8_9PLEO|nr:Altered inheritance of mitochondria protein 18 mitochondrial [Didymosphaeria variabile]KAJ4360970.1 Altered inheritance of mitochondria protein 18 mitochondrial [Didymosphaeria variabile]